MPLRKLTPREKNRAMYCVSRWRTPRQYEFLLELTVFGTVQMQVGPRGGRTWGLTGIDTRTYNIVKRNVSAWGTYVFVEDLATKKVHIRIRETG